MPGGATCEHGKRKRDCGRCCVEACAHGNVPRRCWPCQRGSAPPRPSQSPPGSVWVPGWGHLSTPALLDAGTRGVTLAGATATSAPSANVLTANVSPLLTMQPTPCATCLTHGTTSMDRHHEFCEVVTQSEVANLVKCAGCERYVLPRTVLGAVQLWRTFSSRELTVSLPREQAFWQVRAFKTLGARWSAYETAHGRLRLDCGQCGSSFMADHVVGHALRLDRAAQQGDPTAKVYRNHSSMRALLDDVLPRIEQLLASAAQRAVNLEWPQCAHCCTAAAWPQRSAEAWRDAHSAASRLGWLSMDYSVVAHPLRVALDLGALVSAGQCELPAFASQTDALELPGSSRVAPGELPGSSRASVCDAKVAVLMLVREAVAPLIQSSDAALKPLKGAPGLPTLHSQLARFGSAEDCAAAAGGQPVDYGLVVVVPRQGIERCAAAAAGERAALFCELAKGGGCECLGVCAVRGLEGEDDTFLSALESEECDFMQRWASRPGQCSATAEVPSTSNAGGRCGWLSTPASLLAQPDFRQYASEHTMVLLHPHSLCTALLLYASGPQGRPSPHLPGYAQKHDAPPHCQGQPRYHHIYPGRKCISLGSAQARALFEQGGPVSAHNTRKARAAALSLLVLAALGLDQGPGELLGNQVADTMQYTRELFAQHPSVASALSALAMVKGFYVNFFPAAFHMDADKYMESWSVRQSAAGRAEAGGRAPAPTLVPQACVALTLDANNTVWTANLSAVMHAAQDLGGAFGVPRARGANDAFHLQSRGAHSMRIPRCM